MAADIARPARAEILPPAPCRWVIAGGIGALRRRSQPQVPMELRRRRAAFAGRGPAGRSHSIPPRCAMMTTCLTGPMTLRRSISMAIRSPMLEPNWLPNWVILPEPSGGRGHCPGLEHVVGHGLLAEDVLALGQRGHAMAACMWSGTVTLTESIRSPSLARAFRANPRRSGAGPAWRRLPGYWHPRRRAPRRPPWLAKKGSEVAAAHHAAHADARMLQLAVGPKASRSAATAKAAAD